MVTLCNPTNMSLVAGKYIGQREYLFNSVDGYARRHIENIQVTVTDKSNNTRTHVIPVYIQQNDVTAPIISAVITDSLGRDSPIDLQYPGDKTILYADVTIADPNNGVGVDVDSVNILAGHPGWTSLGLQDNGSFRWRREHAHSNEFVDYTVKFGAEGSDNNGNRSEVTVFHSYTKLLITKI